MLAPSKKLYHYFASNGRDYRRGGSKAMAKSFVFVRALLFKAPNFDI
jgi:hypothetical protein